MNHFVKTCCLLLLSFASPAIAVPPGQSNLLANGSFEFWSMCGKQYSEWMHHFGGKQRLVPVRWESHSPLERSEDSRQGKYSVIVPPGGASMTLGNLECNPGSTYSYGIWAKGKGNLTVRVNGLAMEGWQKIAETKGDASEQWTRIGGELKVPTHLRVLSLAVEVSRNNEPLLLDDGHISCDPGFTYDADAVILKKFQSDKNTIILADFETQEGLSFTSKSNKARLIDNGKFGKGLRMELDDIVLLNLKTDKMPPEGTLECWIAPDDYNGDHMTLSGAGQSIIMLGHDQMYYAVTVPDTRERLYLGIRSSLARQQDRPGEFTHTALTWGADGTRSYHNGTLVAIAPQKPINHIAPTNIQIGSKHSHKPNPWSGIIDEVRLSNVQRYGVLAPKGDKIVPLPEPEVQAAKEAPKKPDVFDLETLKKEIAKLATPTPSTEGRFETQLNEKQQYIYEASSLKPLITHASFELLDQQAKQGMSVASVVGCRPQAVDQPDVMGVYWKLGQIKPGRYWVSVLTTDGFVFFNGLIAQATRWGESIQPWPGFWISDLQVDEPLDLKPGDEIAIQKFMGRFHVARLTLHTVQPERGMRPAPTNLGGTDISVYTSHGLGVDVTWHDEKAQQMSLFKGDTWNSEQKTTLPGTIQKGPDGRSVVRVLACNPMPVAAKVELNCVIHSFYRTVVGTHKEQLVLEPHQSVERLVAFDPIDDEPAYSALATIKALDTPKLNLPEGGDTISFFPGLRHTIGWSDGTQYSMLRRLIFTEPVNGVRQVLNLNGQWEKAYTPEYKAIFPVPSHLKFEPARVPLSWGYNRIMSDMKPRAHSMYLRRTFTVPPQAAGRTYNLVISDAQDAADAWINGQFIGQILGGNVPLVADATKALKVGENEIVILVRDLLPLMNPDYVNPEKPEGSCYYLDVPGHFSGVGVGIEDVIIETSPIVAANELQALPSFRNKKLTAKFQMINHRPEPAKVNVKTHVLAEGKSVLAIDERQVTLAPNQPFEVVLEKPWENPRLWGPEDPYLYVLAVETFDAATGERIDIARSRFGFRECWIDGPSIMLNGVAIRPIGVNSPRYREAAIMTRGTQERPHFYDESGRMGFHYVTQLTNSSSRHNLERDKYWESCKANAIIHIKRMINHPSIVAWDLSNEWLCFLDYYSPDPMLGPKRFKNVSDHVRNYDPTRWTTFNAEGDLSGLLDNGCYHYMSAWQGAERVTGHVRFLPDAEYWRPLNKHFQPGQDIPMCPFKPHIILRPDKKAIIDSEYLWKVGETMPPALTEVCDEDNVLGWAVDSSSGPGCWFWKNKIDGHRDLGVAPIHPYRHPGVPSRAFAPKTFLMPELDHNAFSGSKMVKLYTMMNDGLHPADIELKWELLARSGKVVTKGKDVVRGMKTGYNHCGQIELKLPKVKERTPYTLRVRMYANSRLEVGQELDVDVWPDQAIPAGQLQRRIVLFDPAGNTGKVLDKMGVKHQTITSITEPLSDPATTVLVVGEEALNENSAAECLKVLDFVKAGGRAVFLEQTVTPLGLPAPAKVDKTQWASLCFNRMPTHPIVQGLGNWDLSFWAPDRAVAKGCYAKPDQGTFLTIIDSGFTGGLEYVHLMEQYAGNGIYLLCQLPVIQKYNQEPMAREMLSRIMRYAGNDDAFLKPTGSLQAVITKDGNIAKRLDDVASDYRLAKLDAPLDVNSPTLVEAALARAASEDERSRLASYLQGGGTLVISCPTPDDTDWLSQLAGNNVQFTVQKHLNWHGRGMRKGYSPFTAGLSHLDLYWKNYDQSELASNQAEDITLAIEPLQDYSVTAEGAKELVWPGAMLELKVGKGTLLIDQRRWATSAGALTRHASRNISAMLLGLGVKMAPAMPQRQLPKEVDFRTIDLTQFANRSLADEKSEDGEGGWSDQGTGADLRTFTTGKLNMQGIPFVVGDNPRSCVVLGSINRPGYDKMPKEVSIPVGYATEGFYFLHGFAYSGEGGATMSVYQVVYADGTTFDIALKGGINTRDWATSPSSSFAREKNTTSTVAWTGSCDMFPAIAVYKMLWVNPRPDVEVKSIRYFKTPEMLGVPILMGVTSVLQRELKVLTPAQQQEVRQLLVQSDQSAKAKDLAAAEKLLRQAVAIDPKAWEAFQKLADILEQSATDDQRLELYQAWVHNGTIVPLPYNRIADILEKRKDLRGALEFYTRSLQVEWNQPPVLDAKRRLEQTLNK